MKYTSIVLRLLLSFAFLAAGSQKIIGAEMMVTVFDQIGVGQWFRVVTGVVEIGGVILLWVPSVQILGALLLGGTMVGAVLAHVLILGPSSMPALILGLLSAAVVWLHRTQVTMLKARLMKPAL
ncbi:MAG: DoxX family protein [Alphaproteobacteria bacterium]|nr:DoxX family protein [Alphaproteobacteria bacterium]